MLVTPDKHDDPRGNGRLCVWTWRFVGPQEGESVHLPICGRISVQVVGQGAVTLQGSLDRRHWHDVLELAGPALEQRDLFVRYLRANGTDCTVHVMVEVEK
jgi:hypothetical protein